MNLLAKVNDHQTWQMLTLLTITSGELYTLERYKTFHPKPKNIDGLKKVLQLIWDQLLQNSINKVILSFTETYRACVKGGMDTWWDRHLECALRNTV